MRRPSPAVARNTSASRRMPVTLKPSDCSAAACSSLRAPGALIASASPSCCCWRSARPSRVVASWLGLTPGVVNASSRSRPIRSEPVATASHLFHVVLVRARLALAGAAEDEEDKQDGEHDRAAYERDQPAARAQPACAARALGTARSSRLLFRRRLLFVQPVGRRLLARVVLEEVELDVVVRGPCAHETTGHCSPLTGDNGTRRVWRNSDCAAGITLEAALRRPRSPTYSYAGSLPCITTSSAPRRRAPFRQTL